MVSFVCNICGETNSIAVLRHEESSCRVCGSNVRIRALVYLLSRELFGDGFLLSEFPPLPAVKGLGLSDQSSYAAPLAARFDYTNTFYDREPRLDITGRNTERYGTYDFILASDVFEHVAAPVERAFDEAFQLLKPHGTLFLTVPFSLQEATAERFPGLHEYAVVSLSGSPVLINRRRDGVLEIREDLVFHGGKGATLEMRLFSQKDLESKLNAAGFGKVSFQTEAVPRFGIFYEGGWSLPLVARKQDFSFAERTNCQLTREYLARLRDLADVRERYEDALARIEECGERIDRLDAELAKRGAWAIELQLELEAAKRDLASSQAGFEERTQWALQANADLEVETKIAAGLREKLAAVAQSRWIRLGNRLGVGPKLER
jgi:SAM-dependent methyltransferase